MSEYDLDLHLQADGKAGLVSLLQSARGQLVGGIYRIERLLAAGRQSFVFLASANDGCCVIVKQPAFDYRRPVIHTAKSVSRSRQSLRREYDLLSSAMSAWFPRPLGWFIGPPIVPAAGECNVLADEEAYLVLEFIDGRSVYQEIVQSLHKTAAQVREKIVATLADEFIRFWQSLAASGWYYGDVSPHNMLLETVTNRLRIVDGGGVVPIADAVHLKVITPAFSTPTVYTAHKEGRPVAGTLSSVLPCLAKVMHFALTCEQPLNGKLPDLSSPALGQYRPVVRDVLAEFLGHDGGSGSIVRALNHLQAWLAVDQ